MRLTAWVGFGVLAVEAVYDNRHALARSSDALNARDTPVDIPLEVFQVEAPVRQSYERAVCTRTIVQYDFTASYGTPFVGSYIPPADCTFNTVVFNMTITSAGINYDRLTLLYLGNIEVWRSTTAMSVRTGIYYSFLKDMTAYSSLLHQEQKVIMQLDNIYDSVFTGNFNVTVNALFYNDSGVVDSADVILPISSLSSAENKTSAFIYPDDGKASVSLAFPRNVERAVVSVFASGNGNEEFWYTDVAAQYASTFLDYTFRGYSPWREVQVLIDGRLAGVVWPFPVIFTGGISTGLWVPIVGVDTYDLGSVDVDISPWLGLLCDGREHVFELAVVGYNPETSIGTVASNWPLSASVFLWLDKGGNQTIGGSLQSTTPIPQFQVDASVTTTSNGTNCSLLTYLSAQRTLSHSNTITTSSGTRLLTWSQDLSYINVQNNTASANNETLWQSTNGSTKFSPGSSQTAYDTVTSSFEYPLSFFQAYKIASDPTLANSTLVAILDRSKITHGDTVLSRLTYPLATADSGAKVPFLQTRQNGTSFYLWNNTYYQDAGAIDPAIGTTGATDQWFSWAGFPRSGNGRALVEYGRFVSAVDGYEPVLQVDLEGDSLIDVPDTSVVTGPGVNTL